MSASVGSATLLAEGLHVVYRSQPPVSALSGVDLRLDEGRCVCVIGESGSGKSTLAHATMGLLTSADVAGRIELHGRELGTGDAGWQEVRWREISIVLSSGTALNPVLRIGDQVSEPIRVHLGKSKSEAETRAGELLEEVGLGSWAAQRFPRELSTGQRRLSSLAIALACSSPVLVLDEPTSGLDPQTRQEVLALLGGLRDQGRSILMVTHDVAAARTVADEVVVLYRGWVAEQGPAAEVLENPRHPYTFALLNANPTLGSVKDLRGIRGESPDPREAAVGCPFSRRCTQEVAACSESPPPVVQPTGEDGQRRVACHRGGLVSVLEVDGVTRHYVLGGPIRKERVRGVIDACLTIREAEVVGLVGRNGAGKSTLARIAASLMEPDSGHVRLEGVDVGSVGAHERKRLRNRVQMLFPEPLEALSSRLTVSELVREPLDVQEVNDLAWRREEVLRLLTMVGLPAEALAPRRSHELSTGQLQRVALARALALRPKLLVADEPVECLDPSERAKVLQLLKTVQVERGMAMLLVSHDLGVLLRVADRVAVMDGGRIVEEAPSSRLLLHPQHPVTRLLLEASGATIRDQADEPVGEIVPSPT